jgi:hypothetical protein
MREYNRKHSEGYKVGRNYERVWKKTQRDQEKDTRNNEDNTKRSGRQHKEIRKTTQRDQEDNTRKHEKQ